MRCAIGLLLVLALALTGCGGDRPTEPQKVEQDPFGKGGRMNQFKPKGRP